MSEVGVVIIGRNEGERLARCLASVQRTAGPVVYVDSGSTDDSVATARRLGADVVMLDMSRPFTAARSRNAGFERVISLRPEVRFVQFIDGDCEVIAGWIERAAAALEGAERIGVVAGRLRERNADASIYNRLADMEWDAPAGETRSCGGNAMMRVAAFMQVGGFRETLIAGEEPELCVRLRAAGWRVVRLDAEMMLHDIAMTHWRQWWRRVRRGGYAYAEGAWLHGGPPERHFMRELRSAVAWGGLLPLALLGAAWPTGGASLLGLLLYPAQAWRVAGRMRRAGRSAADARLYAIAVTAAKFAEFQGACGFWWNRLRRREGRIIEYKGRTRGEGPARAT